MMNLNQIQVGLEESTKSLEGIKKEPNNYTAQQIRDAADNHERLQALQDAAKRGLIDASDDDKPDDSRIINIADCTASELRKEFRNFMQGGTYFGATPRGGTIALDSRAIQLITNPKAAQTIGTDGEGGYLTYEETPAKLLSALQHGGNARKIGNNITTANGNPMPQPLLDNATSEGAYINESAAAAEVTLAVDETTSPVHKFTSGVAKVTTELTQDDLFDTFGWVKSELFRRVGRKQNNEFSVGSTSNRIRGLVTTAQTGVTAASATAFTFNEIQDLIDAIDMAYIGEGGEDIGVDDPLYKPEQGMTCFVMHQSIRTALRKLADTQSRPLFLENYRDDPNQTRLFGYPIVINNFMANTLATGNSIMMFGNFGYYRIRDVANLYITRLDELYRVNDQTGFVAFHRAGGFPIGKLDASDNSEAYQKLVLG